MIEVYTTRPDTVFGATFMVLAPEHPLVGAFTTPERKSDVEEYQRAAASKDLVSRKIGDREKTGVFTGGFALNPATGKQIPVWIADYVLMEYGTGAIMAVPGHDERDFAFAAKFGLPIVRVVAQPDRTGRCAAGRALHRQRERAAGQLRQVRWHGGAGGEGRGDARGSRRSAPDGAWCSTASTTGASHASGTGVPRFRSSIATITGPCRCRKRTCRCCCRSWRTSGPTTAASRRLARNQQWYFAPCPVCGKQGRRETDVSDTFLDSAWYFLRYPSTEFDDRPFDPMRTRTWLPVSTYIGGNEHAVLHLLYSRFITMVLHDLGHVDFEEPFKVFRAHGLIVKDGAKMSKSRGNVVVPDEYIARWGADTFRMYLMFLGPFQEGGDFQDDSISGPRRFLDKVWSLVSDSIRLDACGGEIHHPVLVKLHQTKKRVTEGLEELRYNTSIAAMMELVNTLRADNCCERSVVEDLVIMLAPFAPHFAEEAWERMGHEHSVFEARWPTWNEALVVEDEVEVVIQVNGKTRSKVRVSRDAAEDAVLAAAMGDTTVARFIDGKQVRKRIYVPGRLVNFVERDRKGGDAASGCHFSLGFLPFAQLSHQRHHRPLLRLRLHVHRHPSSEPLLGEILRIDVVRVRPGIARSPSPRAGRRCGSTAPARPRSPRRSRWRPLTREPSPWQRWWCAS